MALRSKLIRLAAARPELRDHLLPLLRKASASNWDEFVWRKVGEDHYVARPDTHVSYYIKGPGALTGYLGGGKKEKAKFWRLYRDSMGNVKRLGRSATSFSGMKKEVSRVLNLGIKQTRHVWPKG